MAPHTKISSKISQIVAKQNWKVSVRSSIISIVILTVLVTSAYVSSSVSRVQAIADGLNVSLSNLISIGDTFQIDRQLHSLLSGNICDGVRLQDDSSGTIIKEVYKDGFSERNFNLSSHFFLWERKVYLVKNFPISLNGKRIATLQVIFYVLRAEMLLYVFLATLVWLFCLIYVLRKFSKITAALALDMENFALHIKSSDGVEEGFKVTHWRFQELVELDRDFGDLLFRLKEYREKEVVFAKNKILFEISQQVSHDIRSPLAALEMVSSSLESLSEDKRILVRSSIGRIRDIANSLLRESRNTDMAIFSTQPSEVNSVLLATTIETIVTESAYLYRERLGVRIEYAQNRESYGAFVVVDANELKRIISNLINNSVEALKEGKGTVEVKILEELDGTIGITILDDGIGIAAEAVEKLGIRGFTYGKISGTGLGLYHAKKNLSNWGGGLTVSSQLGIGTIVRIGLPRAATPKWFQESLIVKPRSMVVVFDDDFSIHQIWKGRFESVKAKDAFIELFHISTPAEFRAFYRKHYLEFDEILFLVDYEIIGSRETGLDLIEELGISAEAILVTSRYEEQSIRTRCEILSVKVIPKSMSGFVPIVIVAE